MTHSEVNYKTTTSCGYSSYHSNEGSNKVNKNKEQHSLYREEDRLDD